MPPILVIWLKKFLLKKARGYVMDWLKKKIVKWLAVFIVDNVLFPLLDWLAGLTTTKVDDTIVGDIKVRRDEIITELPKLL